MKQLKKYKFVLLIFFILLLCTNTFFAIYLSDSRQKGLAELEPILRQKILNGEWGGAKEILQAFKPKYISEYEINFPPLKKQPFDIVIFLMHKKLI